MIPNDPVIIDNFYRDPDSVRNFCIKQHFYKRPGKYPGLRTKPINDIDQSFFHYFVSLMCQHLFPHSKLQWDVRTLFQYATEQYRGGWIHTDDVYYNMAGVVYLTPDAPKTCGTSIYNPTSSRIIPYSAPTDPFPSGYDLDSHEKEQIEYNSQFTLKQSIDNVYNRFICYKTTEFHAQDGFFGVDKHSARMIQIFFARIDFVN